MRASDVMMTSLVGVDQHATLEQALDTMLSEDVSGLPVIASDGRLVGILTETDLLRRVELGTETKRARWLELFASPGRLSEEYSRARGRRVDEVMTHEVVQVSPDAPISEVVDLMSRHKLKRIPVVSDGLPVGMVTRRNLLRILRANLHKDWGQPRSDLDILEEIQRELERRGFLPRTIRVSVSEGKVHLTGSFVDEREHTAVCVAVENVEGVVSLQDDLVWTNPLIGAAAF